MAKLTPAPAASTGPRLTGVGVGPGDPELITLKGARAIRAADVVFVPVRRRGEASYALTIARDLVDDGRQRVVTLPFPEAESRNGWHDACHEIRAALEPNRTGAFLVEGDPMLYSSFGHIADGLAQCAPAIAVDVIPGVSSVTAGAAVAGLSLGDYGERVAILPAAYRLPELEATLRSFECVVLLKVAPVLTEVLTLLRGLDLDVEAAYVRRIGRPDQQIVRDLAALAANPPRDYFSLLILRRRDR
jgi:precorrin-2/cobalt-factor-2 C20-methyltransferase